ncbi:Major facilitator transporter-like protein [Mycena venus]|uniref:Major facilitator transporter-like protein n=1 Tax=Mycena venus TaxID=2733690 RepID=A0A8H6X900_9AGAR|nr:Major facilitator transporter-like protein [Mycena venus]
MTTPNANLTGFQILCGIGTGLGMQTTVVAIQVEFEDTPKLLGQAQSVGSFGQFLARYAPTAPAEVARNSPTEIFTKLPADVIPGVLRAYVETLRIVFIIGAPVAVLSGVAVLFVKKH